MKLINSIKLLEKTFVKSFIERNFEINSKDSFEPISESMSQFELKDDQKSLSSIKSLEKVEKCPLGFKYQEKQIYEEIDGENSQMSLIKIKTSNKNLKSSLLDKQEIVGKASMKQVDERKSLPVENELEDYYNQLIDEVESSLSIDKENTKNFYLESISIGDKEIENENKTNKTSLKQLQSLNERKNSTLKSELEPYNPIDEIESSLSIVNENDEESFKQIDELLNEEDITGSSLAKINRVSIKQIESFDERANLEV